jgi:methylenetetrahydrofolate dehydrogenase (NADP+) / methenyltetrahydrofolate cyclohydrolase
LPADARAGRIDGVAIARDVREDVARAVGELAARGVVPGLTVIIVGDDPASHVYVRSKEKATGAAGMKGEVITLPASTSEKDLLGHVDRLNADDSVHGILVQMPLPSHIDSRSVIQRIAPHKDVDGFHPVNVGKLLSGEDDGFVPCTPLGVIELLRRCDVDTRGANAVVIGRSNIVGKPMAALLMRPGSDATVTVCHSRTRDLEEHVRRADIVVAAVGKPNTVTGVDVGVNRVDDPSSEKGYRLVGDVEFDSASRVASLITPVPGGVGPMTIAMLLQNTVQAASATLGGAHG